jgi:hypothetical protein
MIMAMPRIAPGNASGASMLGWISPRSRHRSRSSSHTASTATAMLATVATREIHRLFQNDSRISGWCSSAR